MANGKSSAQVSGSVKFLLESFLQLKSLLEGKAAATEGTAVFSPP